MIIAHPIDDFLFILFPDIDKSDETQIVEALTKYYTYTNFVPKVEIKDGIAFIEINTDKIIEQENTYNKVIALCEKRKYTEAKPLLEQLISTDPTNSEYYRIKGQILSDEGNQDEAINYLIDALKWDPKNGWALLMMGNIFAKYKDDIETAMLYYDQVLVIKPDDNIALNNIGANLMQLNKVDEAIIYFEKAIKINPNYPNTHYALGLVAEKQKNYELAFEHALNAIKVNSYKDGLYGNSFRLAVESAQMLANYKERTKGIIDYFIGKLEDECGKEIRIEISDDIPTAAKIELAENYDRDYHLVRYNSKYPAIEHLVMHELMHLELVIEARKVNNNQLFISNQSFKSHFFHTLDKFISSLNKKGIPDKNIANYVDALYDGMNRQAFNTPIDLFIEDRIYTNFQKLRPIQFISLLSLIQEGIEATTKTEIVKNSPSQILSKSKIYNLVNALHFKELYEVDLTYDHKPTKIELSTAVELYDEFKEYRSDKQPGEEYELVQHWAEDLDLDSFFELVPEDKFRSKTNDQVLSNIENDPFDLNTIDPSKERKMKKFLDGHTDKELNTAVVMYMVGALKYFENMQKPKIKEIAFELATLGMSGIDPNKDGYIVPSIENESFTGYRALSYYYVSWALSAPEMLEQLQMPFDKEYAMAKQLYNM